MEMKLMDNKILLNSCTGALFITFSSKKNKLFAGARKRSCTFDDQQRVFGISNISY